MELPDWVYIIVKRSYKNGFRCLKYAYQYIYSYPFLTSLQLCATRDGRIYVKDKNTYVIIRELHKWEGQRSNIPAIMNLIDILIGDEPEPGMENLHQLEIPDHLKEKFKKEDEEDEKEYMAEKSS